MKIFKNILKRIRGFFVKKKRSGVYITKTDFSQIALPTVQRVNARTLAMDIDPLPTGLIHYLDFQYENPNLYKRILLTEKYIKQKPINITFTSRNNRTYEFINQWTRLIENQHINTSQIIGVSSRAFGELNHPE